MAGRQPDPLTVFLPDSADWTTLGTGGGIQTFVKLFAESAGAFNLDLTVLCSGPYQGHIGSARMVPIMSHAASEFQFASRLRSMVRRKRILIPPNAVALADAEHYAWALRDSGVQIVLIGHGIVSQSLKLRHAKAYTWLFRHLIEARAVGFVQQIVSISDPVRGYYISKYPRFASKIVQIPFGVELATFQDRPRTNPYVEHHLGFSEPIVLFVGRLYAEKNVRLFLDACDELHSRSVTFQAVVVGDGPERNFLELAVSQRPWLHWIPRLERSRVLDLMAVSTSLVISSRSEGIPLVLVEAIASGLPVVSTEVGRANELLRPSNGKVVISDPKCIADALQDVMTWDRDLVRQACEALEPAIDFKKTLESLVVILRRARNPR
jgi:glycosyltransferase involved in cell wall biosynthesis